MIELIPLIALAVTWFVVIPIILGLKSRSDTKFYYKGFNEGYEKAKSNEKRIIRDEKGRFKGFTNWKE